MKLKPLIKTHWVASQNPLTISLEGLQRVVFSPSPEILGPEFRSEEKSLELPPKEEVRRLSAVEDELSESRGQRLTLSAQLFWNAFAGHSLKTPSAKMKALVQSLEFHFENGDCLSLEGVFRRPQFPKFLNPQFYLMDPSCNWEKALKFSEDIMKPLRIPGHLKKSEDYQRAWFVILEILAWSLQRKRQVGDLEVVWCDYRDSSRLGYHVEDLEILKERPLAATLMSEPESDSQARLRIWQAEEWPKTAGVLSLHSEDLLQELENYFLGPSPDSFLKNLEPSSPEAEVIQAQGAGSLWRSCFVSIESGSLQILKSLAYAERAVGKQRLFFVGHSLVSAADFKPQVKIRESEGSLLMALGFEMKSLGVMHFNFPSSLSPAFSPFQGGLEKILRADRKELASRNSLYRTQDLLFLRHQGLLIFTLFEMINWVLGKPLSSGEEIEFIRDLETPEADQQFAKVIRYLHLSIPALLGKPSVPYKELISPKVQEFYQNFLESIYLSLAHDRSLIFRKEQVIEIRDVQSQVLPILRFVILNFIESSEGRFLLRTSSPIGEKFQEALPSWAEPKMVALPAPWIPSSVHWMDIGRLDRSTIALLFEIHDEGVDVELNGTSLSSGVNPFEFAFSVKDSQIKEDGNWFDLHPEIFFNGTRISSDEVKIHFGQGQVGFIEYQGQVYRIDKKLLPSLKSLQRFWDKIKGQKNGGTKNSFGERVFQLQKSQALELLMLKAQGFQVSIETGPWKRVFDYFETGLGVEKIKLPEETESQLLPHQMEGVQWLHDLYELKLGAILSDEMGLGKTFQVLSFLTSLQMRQKLGKCLIVVPTSLVYNWVDEKRKFASDLPLRVFQSAEQQELGAVLESNQDMVVVTTYGLLLENVEFFQKHHWNILTFDEAQNLKNITSMRSVSARKLNAEFKICVTGTPMENNYFEFYSLCDLVVPGSLGDVDQFRRQYVNREIHSESLRELKLISKPLVLRRTKQQVKLNLPAKTVQKVILPFSPKQMEIYKKMAMTFSKQVEDLIEVQGEKRAQIAMFSALMRLRQICSDPAAVPGVNYQELPVKVEHFLRSLQDHLENQESVVVFTQFLSTLGRIRKELEKLGIPTYTLQGSVSAKERVRLISEFQKNPKPAVMLMTLKTGGVGLNLTKASVVYHLEPWWNPAVENQATDRAHRMGQTKDVSVFHLLIEGSLEERIADLKLKKQDSFDRLFGTDEFVEESGFENSNALTREDFLYLLK